MKHLKPKKLLLAVALALGLASPALAQTIPDGYMVAENYLENFQSASASSSSTTLPLGWDRLTDKIGNASTYYATTTSGKEGKAFGNTRGQEQMYNSGEYVDLYDLIITPQVKGTVSFYVGRYSTSSSYNPVVEVYKVTKTADGFTFNKEDDLLFEVKKEEWPTSSTSSVSGWAEQSFNVENYEYLGFRISYAYIDEFEASNAIIPINKSFEITAVNPSSQTVTENSDNTVTLSVTVTVQNTGNVDMGTSLDEKLKLTLAKRLNSSVPYEYEAPFATADIPLLAPNETAQIQISGDYPIPEGLTPNSSGEIGLGNNFFALIDQFPNAFRTLGYIWVKPLKGILNIRYDKNTSKSNVGSESINGPIYYGVSNVPMSKTYHLSNSGPTDLIITNYESTNPDITVEGATFPLTIAAGEGPKDLQIVIGGTSGIKEGTVKFILDDNSLALLDNVTVSGEIVDSSKFFANFESQDDMSSWYAPNGTTSWKIIEYTDTERNNNSAGYYPEYNINNYRLENGNNNSPSHDLYSPKMSFTAGDKISFYAAKRTNSGNDVKLVVKYSPDRANWTELGTISVTNSNNTDLQFSQGTASSTTGGGQNIYKRFEIEIPESGEYYIAFSAGYVLVDNFVGGTLVDVPYDVVSESAKAGSLRMVNNNLTLDASFKNIGSDAVAADAQTVTLYANDQAVATAEAVDLPVGTDVIYNLSYIPHVAGETTLYAEVAVGDFKVKSPSVVVNIAEESATIDNQIGEVTNTSSDYPLGLNYNNSRSEFVYTSTDLANIKGNKIVKIAYPYYKASDPRDSETLEIWMENTDDDVVGSVYKDVASMTKVLTVSGYKFEKAGTGVNDLAIMEFPLDESFIYDPSKNLRVTIRSLGTTYGQAYFGRTNESNRKVLYNRIDSRDSFISGEEKPSTTTGGMPVIILSTEQEVPTISGTVKDSAGQPIAGATVTVTSVPANDEAADEDNGQKAAPRRAAPNADAVYYQTTTDNEGTWSMTIFKPELNYVISVEADGYKASAPVALDLNDPDNNDFTLAVDPHLSFQPATISVLKKSDEARTTTVAINLNVENEVSYQGYQFDVTLPAGVEMTNVVSPITEEPAYMQTNAETNTYKVLAYGSAGTANTEAIATLTLSTKYDATADYPIEANIVISDVVFSTPTGKDIDDISGYTGLLTINLEEVKATEIKIEDITVMEPSYSSADDVTTVTAGENISASVSLKPDDTTDSIEDIEWTVTGAEGITVTVDEEGNMEINTENAEFDGKETTVTITGTVGNATVTKTITVKEVLLGDANANGLVTVSDVVTTAKVAVAGTAKAAEITAFSFPNANVDENLFEGKQVINTQDVTGIVNIILKRDDESGARDVKRQASVFETNDRLVADNFTVIPGKEMKIGVRLDNSYDYAALQATVIVPEGMTVTGISKGPRAASHEIASHIGNGKVGVMLYSLSNSAFAGSDDEIFFIHMIAEENCGNISFDNINASDAASNGYYLGYDGGMNETGTTAIDAIDADNDGARFFDMNGIEFKADMLQPGIYIRVKGDKAEKIVIR